MSKLSNGVSLENRCLHYKVEGSGETLVFIHGLSDDLNYWEVLAANLKKDYQVIRLDLPGHGQSELGSDEITLDLYVDCLRDLLDGQNVDSVNLIGFSLGGAIALEFALEYPERVDSLVLMSSFAKTDSHLRGVFNEFKNALDIGFGKFYDLILPMVLCPKVIEDNHVELELLKQSALQTANTRAYIKAIDACLDFDVEERLSEIEVSTLVMAGKYDEITPVDIQKDICIKIRNSRLMVFDDVKHNLLVGQNNMKILDILNEFLKNKR